MTSVYPRRAGNLVTPWIDGIPFYARLLAAVRAARSHFWAIVSFIDPGFHFPDGTSWWDLLDESAARGLDVRVLFWRNPSFFNTRHVFLGTPADRAFLATRRGGWSARWDASAEPAHCHHQKAYVVDAGAPDAIAFVGGMVLSHSTLAHPGHATGLAKHDAFVELQGPAVHDAIANFVERWNLARQDSPPWPSAELAGPLALPPHPPPPCGPTDVQLCRTIRPGDYDSPGESTILSHYLDAVASAHRTIYLENQHPGEPSLLTALERALRRGVHVVMVVPGEPMPAILHASREVAARLAAGDASHRYTSAFLGLASLGARDNFTLVALARSDATPAGWSHREIYVHAKLCIVDGAWATLGSANLVDLSLLPDHTELNATFWGEATCLPLLRQLVLEHTGLETSDDLSALMAIAAHARAGSSSRAATGPIHGCYAIDPTRYGQDLPSTMP